MRWMPCSKKLRLLGLQPREERRRLRQLGITEIAHEGEVGHDRSRQAEALRRAHLHHVEPAAGDAEGGDRLGEQRQQVVARAGDDACRGEDTPRRHDPARLDGGDEGAPAERDALRLEPGRELRHREAALDPALVRAPERALQRPVGKDGTVLGPGLRGGEEPAPGAHLGGKEGLEHGHRLGTAGGDEEARMLDGDARLRRHLLPDVAGPHRPPPAVARLLAGDGDEAEVADRGSDRLGLAVDHHDAEPAPEAGEGVGEADDAGPDNCQIVVAHRVRQAWVLESARESSRCSPRTPRLV